MYDHDLKVLKNYFCFEVPLQVDPSVQKYDYALNDEYEEQSRRYFIFVKVFADSLFLPLLETFIDELDNDTNRAER